MKILIILTAIVVKYFDTGNAFLISRNIKGLFIFPGTKWCGPGNTASGPDDLGKEIETDKCCRTHDNCEETILPSETKYSLNNNGSYTKLSCGCDFEFQSCLKAVANDVAKEVGLIYFNFLGTKCFKKDFPAVCEVYKESNNQKRCVKYGYDISNDPVFQWFDVPFF